MAALDPKTDFSFINGTGPQRFAVGKTDQTVAGAGAAAADNVTNLGEGTLVIIVCTDNILTGTVQSDGSIS